MGTCVCAPRPEMSLGRARWPAARLLQQRPQTTKLPPAAANFTPSFPTYWTAGLFRSVFSSSTGKAAVLFAACAPSICWQWGWLKIGCFTGRYKVKLSGDGEKRMATGQKAGWNSSTNSKFYLNNQNKQQTLSTKRIGCTVKSKVYSHGPATPL